MTALEQVKESYLQKGYKRILTGGVIKYDFDNQREKYISEIADKMDCNDMLFYNDSEIVVLWAEYNDNMWITGYETQTFLQ